jgi:hypothetical protein
MVHSQEQEHDEAVANAGMAAKGAASTEQTLDASSS